MILIVDLESAKKHLRVTDNLQDDVIAEEALDASAAVIDFLKIQLDSPEVWPPSTINDRQVRAAERMTKLALSSFHEGREAEVMNVLSDAFVKYGSLYRLPTLA